MKKIGILQIFSGMIAAGCTSFFLTWCTNHGIDFSAFGTDAETIKSAMIGGLTGTFIGLTNALQDVAAKGIVDKIIAVIKFVRRSFARISNAAHEPIESEEK